MTLRLGYVCNSVCLWFSLSEGFELIKPSCPVVDFVVNFVLQCFTFSCLFLFVLFVVVFFLLHVQVCVCGYGCVHAHAYVYACVCQLDFLVLFLNRTLWLVQKVVVISYYVIHVHFCCRWHNSCCY